MWYQLPSKSALLRAAGFALAYLAAALVGITFTREAGTIAVFWPANALLIGLLLRVRRPHYALILAACTLASAIANLSYGDPAGVAAARAGLNMLEVLCGYHLILHYAEPDLTLAHLRNLFVLMAASMAAPAVSATGAAIVLGPALDISFPALWWGWWSRDAVGMLLFLPLVVAFEAAPLERLLSGPWDRRLLLATVELAAAFGLLLVVLGLIINADWYGSPTLFAPILLWTALRFGIFPTAAASAMIAVVAVMSAAYDAWPPLFAETTNAQEILSLQLLVILVALPPLVVAVVITERARARRQLDDALESMADAFALYDHEGRLVLCNRRYPEFLPPIADLLTPGVRYEELVREGARRGLYSDAAATPTEAWVAEQVAGHRAGATSELRLADGRWLHAIARPTADGGTVDVRRDITERKLLEEAVEHMAMHDALTNVPNRTMFYRELERALARAQRAPCRIAVIMVDLDRFKDVNDTFGHACGDQLLVEVARRLVDCVRTEDLVARLGGDEFAVISASGDPAEGFAALARRIVDRLSRPVRIGRIDIEVAASLGMTVFPDDAGELDELVAHADRALYAAKEAGRRTWALFDEGMGRNRRDVRLGGGLAAHAATGARLAHDRLRTPARR